MQFHQLKPKNKRKPRRRIGRGGKRGTYCGRGMKGQGSRAGGKPQPIIRGLIKRYPKIRGYNFALSKNDLVVVNLSVIQDKFQEGEKISPQALLEKKLIRRIKGRIPVVKILAKGGIDKKLVIDGCLVSKAAKEKIEKAGGRGGDDD